MGKEKRKRIGEWLLEAGMITRKELEWAINEQIRTNKKIGEILVEAEILTEENVLEMLQCQLGIPYINLEQYDLDLKMALIIPVDLAKRYTVIAVGMENEKLKIAMKDPLNMFALDDLKLSTKKQIIPLLASERSILNFINQVYTSAQTNNIMDQVERQIYEEQENTMEKKSKRKHLWCSSLIIFCNAAY